MCSHLYIHPINVVLIPSTCQGWSISGDLPRGQHLVAEVQHLAEDLGPPGDSALGGLRQEASQQQRQSEIRCGWWAVMGNGWKYQNKEQLCIAFWCILKENKMIIDWMGCLWISGQTLFSSQFKSSPFWEFVGSSQVTVSGISHWFWTAEQCSLWLAWIGVHPLYSESDSRQKGVSA